MTVLSDEEILERAMDSALKHYRVGDGERAFDTLIEELQKFPEAVALWSDTDKLDLVIGACHQPSRSAVISNIRALLE